MPEEPPSEESAPWFETRIGVRSYELDAFGHLNHAVYLNYFEAARIRAMAEAGHPLQDVLDRGWGVHVVRVEVDYRREAHLGDELRIQTRVDEVKRSSITVLQRALRAAPGDPEIVCRARVVWVWVDEDGRPRRVPDDLRDALVAGPPV